MNAGRALRRARERAGLTQRELAARTGYPQPTIARIETNAVSPRVETLARLLASCGDRLRTVSYSGVDLSQLIERRGWTLRQKLEELTSGARALGTILGRVVS